MEAQTFISSCPICGRKLFKGAPDSYFEGDCPKCKEYLKINFYDNGYRVCIMRQAKDSGETNRLKTT